jgi:parallel beta-helix repeat protein
MPVRFLLAALAAVTGAAQAQNAVHFDALEAYGTLQAGGVVATVGGDANLDAAARLEWRAEGDAAWRPGHPLVRVDAAHFAGSLFRLEAGRRYDVRVTLQDADGTDGAAVRTATLATRAEDAAFVPARTLYVAPGGSDANDGLAPSRALRTIQHAADLARAGDRVSIAAGLYRESVRVQASGTAAQPIVFSGEPGAILDGADAAIAAGVAWSDAGGGVWSRPTGFATAHVVSDQGRLFRYASLAELRALAAGAPGGFHFDGTTLSVKFADGSAPSRRTLHVARLNEGVVLAGAAFVRVEGLEIRHYGSDAYGKGVYLRYASDCTVGGNAIHDVGSLGVWMKGGERNLIERNAVGDSAVYGWPWGLVHGSGADNAAIGFTDDVGRGNVIRRNHVYGTYDGLRPCGSLPPAGGFGNETDVYENTLERHGDDAIEAEGHCANLRLWGNRIRDSLMGFAVAPAAPGPVWIVRNVAYDLGRTRSTTLDGQVPSAIKINSGYPTPVGPLRVYHNTFLTTVDGADALVLMQPGSGAGLVSRNNVYAAPGRALTKLNAIAADFDYDALHAPGATLVRWYDANYATLADFSAGTGQEPHGLAVPPALADPAAGDFTPAAGSALIDRGVALPGIDDDYAGAAPDIGAVERDEAVFANGFD